MYGDNQIINEPINFETHCDPSCIDLIFCSQHNLIQNSGTHASLFESCRHQIVYAEVNFKVFSPPPYKRKTWDYNNWLIGIDPCGGKTLMSKLGILMCLITIVLIKL